MRVALLAKVRTGRDQSGVDLQLRTLRSFADVHGWLVTREYVDAADMEFVGGSAKKIFVDASVNWFDIVLVVSIEGFGGLRGASVVSIVEQLARYRVSLVCTHQHDEGSFLGAKVVLRLNRKEAVERDLGILEVPWDLRTPPWSRWRQCSLREWR